ncbi:PepSY domain-containing protein [Magnetospirillum sulfuroxidans]|uniref:PepSY domain-containing protein n=1 Tax=Magnetospirillum sulfuroxidans TaxID=611300 RepID=A0ABS5IAT5_9PROT|nr:PepSY domain-containing protein [Magnetospirillum sulfuroxidans]MBR9970868.1 PepSY domain-containing protein [Magnetospirillum sulfuroxidans]
MLEAQEQKWSRLSLVAVMLVLTAMGFAPSAAQAAQCEPTDKIDGSTVDTARQKIEKGGYRQVRGLKKGCDNFWHGTAVKDGKTVNIVLSPQGIVMVEGD